MKRCIFIGLCLTMAASRQAVGNLNLARGKPYQLSPAPDYKHCTDPGDAAQLTDGTFSEGYFWVQEGTVGWRNTGHATVTLDLGEDKPIAGASWRTAAGTAGVSWPVAIYVFVSREGRVYHLAGDLVAADGGGDAPPGEGYGVHTYRSEKMRTHGRFVKLVNVASGPYTFCDEVEVYAGEEAFLAAPLGEEIGDVERFLGKRRVEQSIRRRFRRDEASLRACLERADIQKGARKKLLEKLDKLAESMDETDVAPGDGFKAVLPLGPWHARLTAVQGELWKAQGKPEVMVWPAKLWDNLEYWAEPKGEKEPVILRLDMMRNEVRSLAFNAAHTSFDPLEIQWAWEGEDASLLEDAVSLYEVPWTDTREGTPVAAALVPLKEGRLGIPSGLVQQVWLRVDSSGLEDGLYRGVLKGRRSSGEPLEVSLELRVHPLLFPERPSLHVGGWDYTDRDSSYQVTPQNRNLLVQHLRERFVDVPWAHSAVMPSGRYDQDGNLIEPPSTEGFDEWIALWPEARFYAVFNSVGGSFDGSPMGTELFSRKVSQWIRYWASFMEKRGKKPSQLLLLLVDEPRNEEMDRRILEWARVIQEEEPDVVIWEDPVHMDPAQANQEMLDLCDVLCPNRPRFLSVTPYREGYLQRVREGQVLWFYSCSGPSRALDPYSYYRLQAWHCFQMGAEGNHFWAFGDAGGASSWNEYLQERNGYTPLFIDEDSVTAGKQMEAIVEGVEDHEYLVLLRQALSEGKKRGRSGGVWTRAEELLGEGVSRVLSAEGASDLYWNKEKDRSIADQLRIEILRVLVTMDQEG